MNIQLRRATKSEWTTKNPLLLSGEVGIETDTDRMKIGNGTEYWVNLDYTDTDIKDELGRLSSKINDKPEKIFTYRGKTLPTFPSEAMLGYYLTFYTLPDSLQVIQFPDVILPEGTIMSIDNNDKNDSISYKPKLGDRIDNKVDKTVVLAPNSVAFLVKKTDGWQTAYTGIIADNLTKLVALIKPLLPTGGAGLTIEEIQAQLKDRLHTFAEIQTEFKEQLHTELALEADGFERFIYRYGFQDGTSEPIGDSWVLGDVHLNEEKILTVQNYGNKNMVFAIPAIAEPLIAKLLINSIEREFTVTDFIDNELHYKALITNDPIQTGTNIRVKFEFGKSDSGGSSTGLEIDDGTSDVASISKLNIKGVKISKIPNSDGMGANEAEVTAGINIHMMSPNEQYGNALCNELVVEPPLQVDDTPTGENTGKLYLEHGVFEPIQSPGMLAYLTEDTEVVGKEPDILKHHKGALWFDDIVVPSGSYIVSDKTNKAYGIQDWTEDDPNVTGGVNYLIAFRASFKGVAPDDGFVKIAVIKKGLTPLDTGTGFLEDINGEPLIVERQYKLGEKLGILDIIAVVNAKGLQEFQCIAIDNFQDDVLVLEDRTEGASGLMIQCIKSSKTGEAKTGNALQQFEIDTNQNVEFSSHYLGVDRCTIAYYTQKDTPMTEGSIGQGMTMNDGLHFYNLSKMKTGTQTGHLIFQDNGIDICDFSFGKIFSAEETQMLRGKKIDFSTTITDKNNGFNVALMKWLGTPDKYTKELYTSRNGGGSPIFQTNWSKVDELFISEDAVSGDHTATKTFTIPADANNYAVIIYPINAQSPLTLKLKEFKIDVNEPFTGYVVTAPELTNELHLVYDKEYKELIQDNQGFASLRYTINTIELPSPVGELGKGLADITLDTNFNKVNGSQARGGEGAIVFNASGHAVIHTQLRLWSEKAKGTKSEINFWWAKVIGEAGSETYDEIADSESVFEVVGGAKGVIYRTKTFTIDVEAGDKLALRMQGNSADAAFLESIAPNKPMVQTEIQFVELVADQGDTGGTGVDLSGFTLAPQIVEYGIYQFVEKQNVDINIDIPADVEANVIAVEEVNFSTGKIRPIPNVDYQYDLNTKIWSFNMGAVKSGQIIIAFYA